MVLPVAYFHSTLPALLTASKEPLLEPTYTTPEALMAGDEYTTADPVLTDHSFAPELVIA
jgi:hypothetical protein